MNVPFVDLQQQHRNLRYELDQAIQQVMKDCNFVLGEEVLLFEEEFARYCGARHGIGVDSGLSALELSLRAFGVGPGDEVIVPAHTFVATAAAVTLVGAQPILVDVDPITYTMDVTQLDSAITPRTAAVIPVHLYGLAADMDAILGLAREHHLIVIEDACQAHGALYKQRRVGSLGDAAAFSFYPAKNLGCCGDGGMVVTDDHQIAGRIWAMRNCGQKTKYVHELLPVNHRLDTLQAAILRVKLSHLDEWNNSRGRHAALYSKLLAESGLITPSECNDRSHVYHLYVIRAAQRDALQSHLRERGIGTGIHYPIPIHLQPFYDKGWRKGQFPCTEELCNEILSLPMFPGLTVTQVEYVAQETLEFLGNQSDVEPATRSEVA